MKLRRRKELTKKILAGALIAGAAYTLAVNARDIIRYIKITRM